MNMKRFFLSMALLVANLSFHSHACAEELFSSPRIVTGPPQAIASSSAAASRTTLRRLTMKVSMGALDTREDPVNLANLGEELVKLHLAAGGIFTSDFFSINHLTLALDSEVWVTAGSYRGADLTTVPILFGVRAALFPSSPVQLYGTGGAGLCIIKLTNVSDWQIMHPLIPIPYRETSEEISVSLAYAVGGGMEFVSARRSRLFSIDYRYFVAGRDASLGGHLLCFSYGFLF